MIKWIVHSYFALRRRLGAGLAGRFASGRGHGAQSFCHARFDFVRQQSRETAKHHQARQQHKIRQLCAAARCHPPRPSICPAAARARCRGWRAVMYTAPMTSAPQTGEAGDERANCFHAPKNTVTSPAKFANPGNPQPANMAMISTAPTNGSRRSNPPNCAISSVPVCFSR